jgi:ABC-type dipeptide/oligopeptide/nickel transport system ATPase subunit
VSAAATGGSGPVLQVDDLRVHFDTDAGTVKAVDGVTYRVDRGETLGIVGESGSGKSVANLTILGLTRAENADISGKISFEGRDLAEMTTEELRRIRGNDISMIFQDPLSSLHPYYKVGKQLVEAIQVHQPLSDSDAKKRVIELLGLVGIPDAKRRADEYPHEFSGGMRQRAMIAMALTNDPKLLIADEPTTALDVTTQAQILRLLTQLQDEFGMALIMITHDLGDHPEIVGDHDHRHPELLAEALDQAQDLRLGGHVEGGGRLVGDQQLRVVGERHRDHHPLPHAARELVRVLPHPPLRIGDPDQLEQLDRMRAGRRVAHVLVDLDRLDELIADLEERMQGRQRVLEDHRDPVAADLLEGVVVHPEEVLPLEADPAGDLRVRSPRQPEDRHVRDALARARLTDDPEHLALGDLEREAVDRLDDALVGREVDLQVLDLEQRLRAHS